MNKKKLLIAFLVVFAAASILPAEEAPIEGGGWYYTDIGGAFLNGTQFYNVAPSFKEQDGWAVVLNKKIHYWLYDSYTYHNGDDKPIRDRYIPHWVEKMGYVIDYDNIECKSPNKDLANSVKALMTQRGCDVSVALITDPAFVPSKYKAFVTFNSYSKRRNDYTTYTYFLY